MPKLKTKSGVKKRFKITATGKVLRRRQGKRHLLHAKNAKRKMRLRSTATVHPTDVWAVKQNMPWG